MTQGAFSAAFTVSRETLDRLDLYEAHLKKWNRAINLVSPASLNDVWQRHFSDSAQLFELASNTRSWIDLGSGGGFPGLVIAILAAEKAPDMSISLVESDTRKCVFLREVARLCDLSATVLHSRIEDIEMKADIVSARALAPLPNLLEMSEGLLEEGGRALFLKGGNADEELTETRRLWHMDFTKHQSRTNPDGVVLEIASFQRRTDG